MPLAAVPGPPVPELPVTELPVTELPGTGQPAPLAPAGVVVEPTLANAAAHTYLRRAAGTLAEAVATPDPCTRYAQAHVAALQSAAALLASRARPTGPRKRPPNAWVLLAHLAPEFEEWARFFAAGAAKRAAAEAGSRRAVTPREADDLVRDAERFLALVEQALGLAPHPALWASGVGLHRAG